jgi:hypothetical protein
MAAVFLGIVRFVLNVAAVLVLCFEVGTVLEVRVAVHGVEEVDQAADQILDLGAGQGADALSELRRKT